MDGKSIAKELQGILSCITKARETFESVKHEPDFIGVRAKPMVSLMIEACNYIESNTKQLITQVRLKV